MRGVQSTSLFRHRDFLKLWAGQTVSEVGSQVSLLAVPLAAVVTLGATPFEVGLLGTLQFLPFLLVGLPAGVWVDRWRRRRILIAADCGRLAALGSIPVAWAFGLWSDHAFGLAQLYVVGFVSGVLTVFFEVAYQAYLPSLVTREQIVDGNAKLTVTASIAQVAGPGVGGLLVALLKAPLAIAADALSYAASVISLVSIGASESPVARLERRSLRVELVEGLRFVLHHKVLRLIATCTGSFNFFSNLMSAVLILYAVRDLGMTPAVIGLWMTLGSLGTPVGAAMAPRLARALGAGRTLVVSVLVGTLSYLILPAAPRALAFPLFVLSGLLASLGVAYNITQVSLRQRLTPQRLQGRMNATMRFLVWGTIPLGSLAGGILGSALSPHAALWIGAIGIQVSVLPVLARPVRTLRRIDDAGPPELIEATLEGEPSAI